VSRRYLAHVRAAWDHAHPGHPLGAQDVVLTVPASFDEVARELTVEAARGAGIGRVTLLEEPQAAFYAWIQSRGDAWEKEVRAGQKILVCDVGGGTTDFTLIRVRENRSQKSEARSQKGGKKRQKGDDAEGGVIQFHRVAVGEHLILGGDNLDLALAHHVERKIKGPGGKLEARAFSRLVASCRALKETLLGERPPEKVTVSVAGGGSKIVGGAVQVEVTRAEVEKVLVDGFLPRVGLGERPAARRSGFREFGLPYAADAGITRYLAAFLAAHRFAGEEKPNATGPSGHAGGSSDSARPDVVLFNGGLFESPVLRERLLEVLSSWFSSGAKGWRPEVLENERLDLAVARGAAYYGMVRRGLGVRISGGLARSYYIGVETSGGANREGEAPSEPRLAAPGDPGSHGGSPSQNAAHAVCVLPAGIEEGQEVELPGRTFELLIRQPVEFPLYYSSLRTTDAPGDLLAVDGEQMSRLPPIRTVLQSGRRSEAATVRVTLHARLSEIGTLELWFAEAGGGDRTWRLEFDVRRAQRSDHAAHGGAAEAGGVVDEGVVRKGGEVIRRAFARGGARPEGLVKELERVAGLARVDWPPTLMRAFWEVLMELEAGRRLSDQHEARWLNLVGFCLRPGYGLAADDWRVAQTWRFYPQRVVHSKNELIRAEWWILWRRLAGGLSAGQQRTLADPLLGALRDRARMPGSGGRNREPAYQFGPHETAEVYRALGAMELLSPESKAELGAMLLDVLARDRPTAIHEGALFALGRLGARVPVYGPLNALLAAEVVEPWVMRLMEVGPRAAGRVGQAWLFAGVQMARLTGDRYRDLSDGVRAAVVEWLARHGAAGHFVSLVREGGRLEAEEQRSVFGESLPRGLRIE
jgi:hypothetical protein